MIIMIIMVKIIALVHRVENFFSTSSLFLLFSEARVDVTTTHFGLFATAAARTNTTKRFVHGAAKRQMCNPVQCVFGLILALLRAHISRREESRRNRFAFWSSRCSPGSYSVVLFLGSRKFRNPKYNTAFRNGPLVVSPVITAGCIRFQISIESKPL